jgi:hypothetical protein
MASTDDLLSALKNVVIALNSANQYYKQGYAQSRSLGLSASSVVSAQSGRVYSINVTTAGSTTGAIYDSSTVAGAGSTNLIFVIPNSVGVVNLNFPFTNGLVYVPGSGQVASISYS